MGNVKRPLRYRQGQKRAINLLGFDGMDKSLSILDVGCGIGTGMLHFNQLGFSHVYGIDKDDDRVCLAKRRNLNALNWRVEDLVWVFEDVFDIIWASHSFEHFRNPSNVLDDLRYLTREDALLFFVLPYPDLNPSELHIASRIIGLNVDDDGKTVIKWFEDRGLELLYSCRDDFREPEMWLKFRKK